MSACSSTLLAAKVVCLMHQESKLVCCQVRARESVRPTKTTVLLTESSVTKKVNGRCSAMIVIRYSRCWHWSSEVLSLT
jgi:hypothetical protein